MYIITSWGAPRTGLPFVLFMSFDKTDNKRIDLHAFRLYFAKSSCFIEHSLDSHLRIE